MQQQLQATGSELISDPPFSILCHPMAPHPELIVAVAAENHLVTHGTVSRK
jgi:hypothetical protein